MSSPEERIRELARSEAIAAEDAARLLSAVGAKPASRGPNPFVRWGGERTAPAGLVVALVGLGCSRLGVRFDGAFDLHTQAAAVPLVTALVDQGVAVLLTALVFFGAARTIARQTRFIDVLGAVGLARLPLVLVAAPIALVSRTLPPGTLPGGPAAAAIVALSLLGVGLHIFLLVLGLRTASSLGGGRLAAIVVAGIVVAEIVTKIALSVVPF